MASKSDISVIGCGVSQPRLTVGDEFTLTMEVRNDAGTVVEVEPNWEVGIGRFGGLPVDISPNSTKTLEYDTTASDGFIFNVGTGIKDIDASVGTPFGSVGTSGCSTVELYESSGGGGDDGGGTTGDPMDHVGIELRYPSGGQNEASVVMKVSNTHDSKVITTDIDVQPGNKQFTYGLDPGQTVTNTVNWSFNVTGSVDKQLCADITDARW